VSIGLVLASSSTSRRMMLEAAGVPFTVAVPSTNEETLKPGLLSAGKNEYGLAEALAREKAASVSRHMQGALVLGADQVLVCEGRFFNKATTAGEVRDTLNALSDREHRLVSAAVIVRDGIALWQTADTATMRVRQLSPQFIEQYLSAEMPEILGSLGCYRIEGRGAQIFTEVSGDHFAIRGLPLIPLLAALRDFGVIPE
jgi:septum formation protein